MRAKKTAKQMWGLFGAISIVAWLGGTIFVGQVLNETVIAFWSVMIGGVIIMIFWVVMMIISPEFRRENRQ